MESFSFSLAGNFFFICLGFGLHIGIQAFENVIAAVVSKDIADFVISKIKGYLFVGLILISSGNGDGCLRCLGIIGRQALEVFSIIQLVLKFLSLVFLRHKDLLDLNDPCFIIADLYCLITGDLLISLICQTVIFIHGLDLFLADFQC